MKPCFGLCVCEHSCRNLTFASPLPVMQQEVGPLGLCFLLLWFPTDCLCPHANRISHASFPMVSCPVLASWWMELHIEEWVCYEVCLVLVRQRGWLQPPVSICFGQFGHLWCGRVDMKTTYNAYGAFHYSWKLAFPSSWLVTSSETPP